jgi:dolichol-phosphate mannosyltransferase
VTQSSLGAQRARGDRAPRTKRGSSPWPPERARIAPHLPTAVLPVVWVCVPTYNEAPHVQPLCIAVLSAFREAGIDGHLLVIDDASPDGTGKLADALRAFQPRLHVLHRESKDGIGPAYAVGFEHALAHGADLVVEMDCDFSHDPASLRPLIEAAATADIVLGSRYVTGGRVKDWPLRRRLISRGGCWYARRLLSVDVRDLTGGFKCFRREVLERLLASEAAATGYGFQIEMTYRALLEGYTVAEVPITFRDRQAGQSKMTANIAVEAAVTVLRLRRLGRRRRHAPLRQEVLPLDHRAES